MSDLFEIDPSTPSELDLARARFHNAQEAFRAAQEAEDECELGLSMPRAIRDEFRESKRALERLETKELNRRFAK